MPAKPGEPTHEFIAAETRRFEILGGCIRRLPDQLAVRSLYGLVSASLENARGLHGSAEDFFSHHVDRGYHIAAEFDLYTPDAA